MSNITLPDHHGTGITPGDTDQAPCECQWDAKRERHNPNLRCATCSARAQEWRRLCAEAAPAVNIFGERLDQLPAPTLADHLTEVDEAVADGICSATWARQARRNILDRHRAEPAGPSEAAEASAQALPLDSERITETTGCDPPEPPGALARRMAACNEAEDFAERNGLDPRTVYTAAVEAVDAGHQAASTRLGDLPYDFPGCDVDAVAGAIIDRYRLPLTPGGAWFRQAAQIVPPLANRAGWPEGTDTEGFLFTMFDIGWALAHAEAKQARYERGRAAEDAEHHERERRRSERAERRAQRPRQVVIEPRTPLRVRPHVVLNEEPTREQQADLEVAWSLVASAPGDYDAWLLLRQAAVATRDDEVAAMAKARLRNLRRGGR